MKKFIKSPFGKMLLEAGRWAVLGAVSIFLDKMIELIPGVELTPDFAIRLTAFLRFVDLLFHKSGVAEKGLTRF